MDKNATAVVYIHGKGGSAAEAEHYKSLFPGCTVAGLEYTADTPWDAQAEFPAAFEALTAGYERVLLIANSIGAYFAMGALADRPIEKAYFISPIVDMPRLIRDMMGWAGVTPDRLEAEKTIQTPFGETLSWQYYTYAEAHPLQWAIPTRILWAGQDNLTSRETITAFAAAHNAILTVMEEGEHWFHTPAQMAFLDWWILED